MSTNQVKKFWKHRKGHLMRCELENTPFDELQGLPIHQKKPGLLYMNFRDDETAFAISKFQSLQIDKDSLFKLQTQIPVIYPWNPEYHGLRYNVNRCFNIFPLMIVMAESISDIQKAFHFACKYNLPIRLRGGSHSFEGYSLGDGMIIDQSRRQKIKINTKNNTVKVQAGTLLGPLLDKLYKKGRLLPVGSCPNNGVAGFTQGGGIGILTRKYGATADSLKSMTILTADAQIREINCEKNKDLFWACCGGGGGNFGIALDFTFSTYSAKDVIVFSFDYPFSALKKLVSLWQQWVPTYSNDLTLNIRVNAGKGTLNLSGQLFSCDMEYLTICLQPFSVLGPIKSDIQKLNYISAVEYNAGEKRWCPFFRMKTSFFQQDFPPLALDILEKYLLIGKNTYNISIKAMGGKNDQIPINQIAFPHRNMKAWFLIDAQWNEQSEEIDSVKWLNDFYAELQPYLPKNIYVNCPDSDEKNYLQAYYMENLPRLIEIKKKYDPTNIFNFQQSIPTSL